MGVVPALVLGLGVLGAAAGVGVAVAGGSDDLGELPLTAVGYYACPGDVDQSGEFHRGDRVIATGRDASGDWLEVRGPDLSSRVWVEAQYVVADATTDGLPAVDCASVDDPEGGGLGEAGPAPGVGPGTGSETEPGAPTAQPGVPAAPGRDTTGPAIGPVGATPDQIFEQWGGGNLDCQTVVTSTITASISDPSGIVSTGFTWSFPGASGSGALSGSGTYQGALGPFPYGTYPVPSAGVDVTVTVSATDGAGNTSTRSRTVRLRSAEECIV